MAAMASSLSLESGPPSKKPRLESEAQDAASGAETINTTSTMEWSTTLTKWLEMDPSQIDVQRWAKNLKTRVDAALLRFLRRNEDSVSMKIPDDVMSFAPLAISDGAASSSSFREVMDYVNMQESFRQTGQYEASGTIWMLNPCESEDSVIDESVTFAQIEAARRQWSNAALAQSASTSRRFSFDITLVARIDKTEMARRHASSVVMSAPLPMIATDGREVTLIHHY